MPNSKKMDFFFNRLDQLKKVEINGRQYDFNYNPEGTIDNIVFPDGVTQDFGYTTRNWVEQITVAGPSGTLFDEWYEYDDVGNLKLIRDLTESKEAVFGYDNLYRLTSYGDFFSDEGYYGDGFGTVSFGYDEVGNRKSRALNFGDGAGIVKPETYTYADYNADLGYNTDRLTATTRDNCDYTYDGHGNLKTKTCDSETASYEYDSNNMITRIDMTSDSDAPRTLTFKYDSLGRRIYKKSVKFAGDLEKGKETVYIYGVGSNPIMVLEEDILDMPEGVCGNGICEVAMGETCAGCYRDCMNQQADCVGRSMCLNRQCTEIPHLYEVPVDEYGRR